MITIATLHWQANDRGHAFSAMYDESWVERLYRGFARNLTQPFRFVVYTERWRSYDVPTVQVVDLPERPTYADCIRPYEMGEPMILAGLDTVVTGNIDHLADYCLSPDSRLALPRDPYKPERACNGVALVPGGLEAIATEHRGENDMAWLRTKPHAFIDDLFPGQVVSFKGKVEAQGLGDARIVYFHGHRKPHELREPWISEHWR